MKKIFLPVVFLLFGLFNSWAQQRLGSGVAISDNITNNLKMTGSNFIVIISKTHVSCNGFCDGKLIIDTIIGGIPPYSYSWLGTGSSNDTLSSVSSLCADTFALIVLDSADFHITSNIIITEPFPLTSSICDSTNIICFGQCTGTATVCAVGGTRPYTYSWTPNGAWPTDSANTGLCADIEYKITIVDSNLCVDTSTSVTLFQPPPLIIDAGINDTLCFDGTTTVLGGSPTVNVGSGTPPYTFFWSPPADLDYDTIANPTFTPSDSGTTCFDVTVTDSNGCVQTDTVCIIVNPLPVVDAGTDDATCVNFPYMLGGSPTASGAGPPFIYSWAPDTNLNDNSISNPTFTPPDTGVYEFIVCVIDSNGCSQCDTVIITVDILLHSVDAGLDTVLCDDGTTVVLGGSLTASGAGPPFTYFWDPPGGLGGDITDSNPTFTPLGSGIATFVVSVTNINGCVVTDTINITVTALPTVNAGSDFSICFDSNSYILGGSPTASGAGPPFLYTWLPDTNIDDDTIANPSFIAPDTGTYCYTLEVSDTNGCIQLDTVCITVVPSSVVDAGIDDTVCIGIQALLGGSPVATGIAPFTYDWSPVTGLNYDTISNPTFTPIDSGRYCFYVMVTDSVGCIGNVDTVCVVVNPLPVVNAGNDTSVCDDGTTIVLGSDTTAIGSGPPFTYLWIPSDNLGNGTIANPTFFPPGPGLDTFIVTVTDTNSCFQTDTVIITIDTLPVVDAGPDTSICMDSISYQLGGSPTASGAGPTFIYYWSPSGLLGNDSIVANPQFLPPDTGTFIFIVCVNDTNDCVQCDTVVITVTPLPVVDAGSDDTVCVGICDTLGGLPTAFGQGPPFTYAWSQGALLSDPAVANPVFCPTDSGTYKFIVTVTDTNGCIQRDTVVVFVNPLPVVDAGFDSSICFYGDSIKIGGLPTATGSPSFIYSWSPEINLNDDSIDNPTFTPSGTGSTEFIVIVTDTNGCVQRDTVNITVTALPVVNAGIDDTVCIGITPTIGGSPTATGTGPFSYLWSPGGNLITATDSNPVFTPPDSGIYCFGIIVTDTNGCVGPVDSVCVVVNPLPVVNAGNDTSLCDDGTTVVLGGVPTALGSGPPFTYLWIPSDNLDNGTIANPTFTPPGPGIYTFTVTVADTNGCIQTDTVIITIDTLPVVNAGPDTSICNDGNTHQLGGLPTASGAGPIFIYNWSPGGLLPADDSTLANPLFSPPDTGTFTFIICVTDTNDCVQCDTVVIIVTPLPVVDAGSDDTVCVGICDTLGGSQTAFGQGPPFTYAWSQGALLSDPAVANPVFCPTDSGTYEFVVTVTDTNGCIQFDTVVIFVKLLPVVNAGLDSSICFYGDSILIGSSQTASGSGPPFIYSWTPELNLNDDSISNPTFTPPGTGTTEFIVIVTDSNGCVERDTVNITVNALPVVDAGSDAPICFGDSTTIGGFPTATGTPPFTYQWTPGTGLNSSTIAKPVFTPAASGTDSFIVIVTDSNSCIQSDTINVTTFDSINANVFISSPASCGDSNGIITINTITGGLPPYKFSINGSDYFTDTIFDSLASGVYTIYITDSLGCTNTYNITITDPNLITANPIQLSSVSCDGGNDGVVLVDSITGGNLPYQFSIDNFNTFQLSDTFKVLSAGVYNICIRDIIDLCKYCYDVTISEPSPLIIDSVKATELLCFGDSNGSIIVFANGGTRPYEYSLNSSSPYQPDSLFSDLFAGSDTVYIKDTNGCIKNTMFTIIQPTKITEYDSIINGINCYGLSTGKVFVSAIGGTPLYQFLLGTLDPNGDYRNDTTFTDLNAGTYTIFIIDINGCVISDSFTLVQNPEVIPVLLKKDVTCYGGSDGEIVIENFSAPWLDPPFQYRLDTNSTYTSDTIFDSLQARIYSLIIKDSISDGLSCEYIYDSIITISEPELIVSEVTVLEHSLPGSATGQIQADNTQGGGTSYLYSLDDLLYQSVGETYFIFYGLKAGIYTLWIKDNYECKVSYTVTVEEIPVYIPYFIPNVFTPNGDGKNDYFMINELPENSELIIYNRMGRKIYQNSNYQNDWNAKNISDGVYFYLVIWPNKEKHKGWVEIIR